METIHTQLMAAMQMCSNSDPADTNAVHGGNKNDAEIMYLEYGFGS
jgi:hypothetical protein